MKILHITPHLGGGVGTVIMDWMEKVSKDRDHLSRVLCLDYANEKAERVAYGSNIDIMGNMAGQSDLPDHIASADIVLVHYWNHPMLTKLFSRPIPDCRLVFWCHKNIHYTQEELNFPDLWLDTSPIQGHGKYIWSTGNMDRFLKLERVKHEGFNIGTVCSPKLHPRFLLMCHKIGLAIPDAHFTIIGDNPPKPHPPWYDVDHRFTYTGKVDDVAPYLATMDVFSYPLRPDHYGTCEQALGEAMAAGVVSVMMNNPAENLITFGAGARSEEEYIHFIKEWYKQKELRSVFSTVVRICAKLYSIDVMIKKWNEVFEDMMKQSKQNHGVLE